MAFGKFARKIGGWKAQKEGKNWEAHWRFKCQRSSISVIRIPDGCQKMFMGGRLVLKAVKSPFDWILGFGNQTAFVDTKSIDADRLVHSKIIPHQVLAMETLARHGNVCGYVVFFRPVNKVVFVNSNLLAKLSPRSSIGHEDGLDLGTLEAFDPKFLFQSAK